MGREAELIEIDQLIKRSLRIHSADADLQRASGLIGRALDSCELLPKDEVAKLKEDLQKLKEAPLQYAIFMGQSPHDERDVLVGIGGSRYEVRLAEGLREQVAQLRPGQQVLLNPLQNVVAIRSEYTQGDTAEVVNVLRPANSAEIIAVVEEEGVPKQLVAKWREGEEHKFDCADALKTAPLHRGDIVEIDPDAMRAIAKLRPRLHIRAGGSDGTIVEISDRLFDEGVRLGDLVRVEPGLKFAFEKLPSFETGGLTLEDVPDVTYDDIGGLDQQIEAFRDAVELPYLQRSLFARYQLTRPKGILLYGPPGCGKTMVAKAVANSLTESIRNHLTGMEKRIGFYLSLRKEPRDPKSLRECRALLGMPDAPGDDADLVRRKLEDSLREQDVELDLVEERQREIRSVLDRGDGVRSFFLNIKGPELLDKYVGETEHRIRSIFEEARSHASYYTPVIIFFDEMEAMFRARGTGRSSDVETTIVPQFLSEIDGVEGAANVLLIGATNRDDMIDPAILRPGRLDVKIRIGRPNREAAAEIFTMYLSPTLPLDANGLKKLNRRFPGNLVFRTAYARQQSDPDFEMVRSLLPPACDVRLALSFSQKELEWLAAFPHDETVRQVSSRAQQSRDSDPVWSKVNRLKPGARLHDLVETLQAFSARSGGSSEFAGAVDRMAEKEQVAESLIDHAVDLLYSSSSYIRVITRILPGSSTARYNFAAHDFITGAVISSIVSRAKRSALKREVAATGKGRGISAEDLAEGIRHEFKENREQFAIQKLRDELGKSGEEVQLAELHLETGMADPWNEEKPRPYRDPNRPRM